MRLKKGAKVQVLQGRDRGKTGVIISSGVATEFQTMRHRLFGGTVRRLPTFILNISWLVEGGSPTAI